MSRVVWRGSGPRISVFEIMHDALWSCEDAPGELLTPGATSGRSRPCQPADGPPVAVLPDPDEGSPVPSSGSPFADSST